MTPRQPPYSDAVPIDRALDYIYRKTGVLLPQPKLSMYINRGDLRTLKRPRQYGGGVFTRKAWLDEFIRRNS